RRLGRAVRLEVDPSMSAEGRDLLMREVGLGPSDVYTVDGPLDLGGLWAVHELERPELKDDVWVGLTQPSLASVDDEPVDIFSVLRGRDVLLHHPSHWFTTSVG